METLILVDPVRAFMHQLCSLLLLWPARLWGMHLLRDILVTTATGKASGCDQCRINSPRLSPDLIDKVFHPLVHRSRPQLQINQSKCIGPMIQ